MTVLIRLFPLIAILVSVIAVFYPQWFVDLRGAIIPLLGVVMFCMGISLLPDDFIQVFRQPSVILLGLTLQYLMMPLLAWMIGTMMNLPLLFLTGMVIVGACPGGTASNVICYLAKGNVALSITLTAVSTFCAVLLTPFFTWLYIGRSIDVPVISMIRDIALVVLLPVSLGVICNYYLGHFLRGLKQIFPIISMAVIILIIGIIMALNHSQLTEFIWPIMIAVALHNLLGLLAGYAIPALIGYEHKTCRTLAIEVGMQNSGLGVALADKYFTTLAALPGAIFSIWHNISGALLAAHWTGKAENKNITSYQEFS